LAKVYLRIEWTCNGRIAMAIYLLASHIADANLKAFYSTCTAETNIKLAIARVRIHLQILQAADAANGAPNLALEKANAAIVTLNQLKPRDDKDETQRPATIAGGLVYDVLTRSARYWVDASDKKLALDQVGQMQTWVLKLFGEPFDSLTDCISELKTRNR